MVPAAQQRPAGVVLRSEDEAVHADRHLLLARTTCSSTTTPNETVYFNELSGPIFGWIDTKVYDQTKDEQKAVGWCGQVLDTNGDGKITRAVEPVVGGRGATRSLYQRRHRGRRRRAGGRGAAAAAPFDPKLDTHGQLQPVRGDPEPGRRLGLGRQPSAIPGYPGPPAARQQSAREPARPRSSRCPSPASIRAASTSTRNGVVWTALAASSHLASFDVRKCKDLNGPAKVDGSQCREGWTLYQTTGPKLKGTDIPADFHYYNWVDQHNISGSARTRRSRPARTPTRCSRSIRRRSEWTTLRVPYPLGFYSRGMDGRIDDPNAGWKGARCTRTTARTSSGTSRAARAPRARS